MGKTHRTGRTRDASRCGGVVHERHRHTSHFTVVGNHLAQHKDLSFTAMGVAVHIQSLPPGARVNIKTLARDRSEGATRIAAALRELERYGYLRRERTHVAGGRIVTRTVYCDKPGAVGRGDLATGAASVPTDPAARPAPSTPSALGAGPEAGREGQVGSAAPEGSPRSESGRKKRKPLPAVPQRRFSRPELVERAVELLTGLRRHSPELTLSACDVEHLTPGVVAWLGLGHQTRSMCTDGNLVDCEANGTSAKSMMGGGGPATGISAPEMIRAGWLDDGEAVKVAGSGTYELRSLHGEGGGVRALDIPMGEDRLVVEYRHAAGSFDQGIEGVHAYRVPKGNYGSSSLLDLTEANRTAGNDAPADADAITSVTDRASKVSVAVVSSGNGRAEVKVALDGEDLSAVADAPEESAAPAPEHTGTDTDAGDGLPEGTEARSGGQEKVTGAEGSEAGDSANLAATGGDASILLLAGGGVALVAAGACALSLMRRRRRA